MDPPAHRRTSPAAHLDETYVLSVETYEILETLELVGNVVLDTYVCVGYLCEKLRLMFLILMFVLRTWILMFVLDTYVGDDICDVYCWGEGKDATLRSSPFSAVAGLTKTKRAGIPFVSFSTRRRPAETSPRSTASSCSKAHV
jgi:hypothetical protein